MKEKKYYFSLKFKGGNVWHRDGTQLKLTERIVNIGETADCDVHYESAKMNPEYYASIIRNEDGTSWRIVKRSQFVEISIAGKGEIGYAHQLSDGDLIKFDRQQMGLYFHTHYDNHYDEVGQHNLYQWVLTCMFGFIAMIVVVLGLGNKHGNICVEDVEPLEESIYYIKVDSVKRLLVALGREEWIPPTKVLRGEAPTGTAFHTSDGKLITARHCVEYWIGKELDLTTRVEDMEEDDIIRWAIENESFNQTHDSDSSMQLCVFFSIFDFMGNKKYSFSSYDGQVKMNTDKDGIFMLSDFSQEYYWRSIRPYFIDREMELGDILWIDSLPEQGKVQIASKEQVMSVKSGSKLMICGYPMTCIGDKQMTSTEGTIRRNVSIDSENLFFESNINHGFSGGPVLTKVGSDIIAIGVVSRVDSVSSGLYKFAVPITEINRSK